jgi:cytoskeletal protein CcmA (bactofilin family)
MFSKKPEPRAVSGTPRVVANGGSTFSVIGTDVSIRGDISAAADLHVDGTVAGDIDCASLVQGESSLIEGAIMAGTARLAGTVKGTIKVQALVILKSAKIEGDVHYDTLTIEQGASVDGRFAHDIGPATASATFPDEAKSEDEPRLTLAS